MTKPAPFEALFSSPLIHNFLKENKLTKPTDVQAKIIPELIRGKSLDIVAPTGSGKTYSFLLPLSELLKEDEENHFDDIKKGEPRAVILVPTRELSLQINTVMKSISHHVKLRIRHLVGGEEGKKTHALGRQFVDVLVSTPGRLSSALKKKEISLKNTKYFIIDEADQLLEMGFQKELEVIYGACDKDLVHVGLFSATRPPLFEEWRGKIFQDHLFHFIELNGLNRLHTHIKSFNIYLSVNERPLMLQTFIKDQAKGKGVIFVNQQDTIKELYALLSEKFPHLNFICLHGELEPKERKKVYDQFINKKAILIATDIVARGLDVEDLRWVLNYDLPFEAVYYVHRAGRVGRGGKEGEVYNFVTPRDMKIVGRINNAIKNQTALKLTVFDEKKFVSQKAQKEVTKSDLKEKELKKIKTKLRVPGPDPRQGKRTVKPSERKTETRATGKAVGKTTDRKTERKRNLSEKTGYAKTVKKKHTPRYRKQKSKKK